VSQLLTVEDAARLLSVTPSAVRKWMYQRRLPVVKLGRLTRLRLEDVERAATVGLGRAGTPKAL
jgi:excisionase family DNA binding protein